MVTETANQTSRESKPLQRSDIMSITKTEYILRSLKKITHKKWEFFVISRILHGLSDDEIEFITQQLVKLSNGGTALTDLYFPQFEIHLEIDEGYHQDRKQIEKDIKRERDIVQRTQHSVKRIKVTDGNKELKELDAIRAEVDNFIQYIFEKKQELLRKNEFTPWDFDSRYSSEPVIKRGFVSMKDNVVFRLQVEALRCFGFQGKVLQRGAWKISDGTQDVVWFPRLFEYGIWKNELVSEGQVIYERALDGNEDAKASIAKQMKEGRCYPKRKYIVFAKAKDNLGFNLLRYVGTFQMNFDESTSVALKFNRIATKEDVRK